MSVLAELNDMSNRRWLAKCRINANQPDFKPFVAHMYDQSQERLRLMATITDRLDMRCAALVGPHDWHEYAPEEVLPLVQEVRRICRSDDEAWASFQRKNIEPPPPVELVQGTTRLLVRKLVQFSSSHIWSVLTAQGQTSVLRRTGKEYGADGMLRFEKKIATGAGRVLRNEEFDAIGLNSQVVRRLLKQYRVTLKRLA